MANDTISRQAAIDAIYETFCYAYCDNCEKEMNEDLCGDCHRKYQNWAASKKIISKTINSLPSAERHGRWIFSPDDAYGICTMCHYKIYGSPYQNTYLIVPYNYCPNCGAKMNEMKDE